VTCINNYFAEEKEWERKEKNKEKRKKE